MRRGDGFCQLLDRVHIRAILDAVTGSEFLRRLGRLAKRTGADVRFDAQHGDGSHGRICYGAAFATLKDRKKDLGKGLLHEICRQPGIDPEDL